MKPQANALAAVLALLVGTAEGFTAVSPSLMLLFRCAACGRSFVCV